MNRLYEVELWSRQGVLLADVSALVKDLRFTLERNTAEQLSFSMNLDAYESLCADMGVGATSILSPYQTDVKIKRNGAYLFGSQVGYVEASFGEIDNVIQVKAFGYLNLLIDRYVTASYNTTDAVDIAWDLIEQTQAATNGDLGMTQGVIQTTTVNRDRTYERQNVKEAIVNLTKLIDGNFDFEFTYDRVFNTYTMIGSDKSASIEFVYPRNITNVSVPRDGLSLFNEIYGLGSGFGDDQLQATEAEGTTYDTDSQLNYGRHEKIISFNSVVLQDTLDQNTAAQLKLRKTFLEIPQMTVNGTDFDLDDFGIGDRVTVRIEGHPFVATVDGVYRIEKMDISVDENEAEEIRIYFDNIDADQEGYVEDPEETSEEE